MVHLTASLLLLAAVTVSALPQKRSALTDCLTAAKIQQDLPATTNFTQDIKPFNLRIPFTPVALALPTSASQVQSAVSCAASLGIKVAPRGGGHSYAAHGLGGEDGHFIIDLRYMSNITVDATTQIATVGAGARLGNVALALYDQGKRAISHGTCPGVGIGGHVLGGGYGFSSRTHGLALDNLIEANVILANSTQITASKTQNSDIFWALRGAGPSYGVVTSFKFQTYPAPENNTVFTYNYSFNQTGARATFEALQTYANTTMPAEMNLRLFANGYSNTISGVYYGSKADFATAIAPLMSQLPKESSKSNSTKGWLDTLLFASNGQLKQPVNYDYHETFFAKSLMTKTVSAKGMDDFVDYWFKTSKKITRDWFLIIDLHGGPSSAITKVNHADSSYAHRDALLKYQLYDRVFGFGGGGSTYPSDGFSFLNGWADTVISNTPEPVGMYFNYADTSLNSTTAQTAYWGTSLPKLKTIKTAVDPKNVFTNPQAVNSNSK